MKEEKEDLYGLLLYAFSILPYSSLLVFFFCWNVVHRVYWKHWIKLYIILFCNFTITVVPPLSVTDVSMSEQYQSKWQWCVTGLLNPAQSYICGSGHTSAFSSVVSRGLYFSHSIVEPQAEVVGFCVHWEVFFYELCSAEARPHHWSSGCCCKGTLCLPAEAASFMLYTFRGGGSHPSIISLR